MIPYQPYHQVTKRIRLSLELQPRYISLARSYLPAQTSKFKLKIARLTRSWYGTFVYIFIPIILLV